MSGAHLSQGRIPPTAGEAQGRVSPPAVAVELARVFSQRGHRLYLVGGWIRNHMLASRQPDGSGLDPDQVAPDQAAPDQADLDFATDSLPEQTLEILRSWTNSNVWTVGIDYGTLAVQRGVGRIEITTLRREVYQSESRRPHVEYDDDIQVDLSRRDFTINAMALALPSGEVIDPFGGMADLAAARITSPSSPEVAFEDDPLRMLRALRFASVLEFDIDGGVIEAISEMRERLQIVSAERIRDEFAKLMVGGAPSKALWLAAETRLADEFLPELSALRLAQDPVHRHKDVFAHTLAVLDNVCLLEESEPDLVLRLAALFHDIGKPATRRIGPEGVSFHHHEVVGANIAEERLRALRFSNDVISLVRELVYLHLRFHTYRLGWSDSAVRRYVRDAGNQLSRLNKLVRSDCTTRNPLKALELSARMDELESRIEELAKLEELQRIKPALDGNEVMAYLGIPPGPQIGKALAWLLELRLEEGEMSKEQAYKRLSEWAASAAGGR